MSVTSPTTETDRPGRGKLVRSAPALVGAAGLGAFAAAVAVSGALQPGYSHLGEGISALAATGSVPAPIMIGGFLALAAGTTAAGVGLWERLGAGVAGRIGAVLVMLSGLAMVVVGLNRQDCSDLAGACAAAEEAGTLSGQHMIHQLVSLAVFLLLSIAAFPLARGLRRGGAPRRFAVLARVAGAFGLLVIAAMVSIGFGDFPGLVQRLFILVVFGLPVLLAAVPTRR
jgi:hypothetical membrane protein